MIVYMAIAFLIVGILVPFVGTAETFLTCVIIAALCLVIASMLKRATNVLYLIAALCIVVLPNTTFVPQVNSIVGSLILVVLGAIILITQIRQARLIKSL